MEKSKNGESIFWSVLVTLGTFIAKTLDSQKKPTPPVTVRRIYRSGGKTIDVKKIINVRANSSPYHKERGWKKNGQIHRGYFRCRLGAFHGEIEKRPDGNYKFFIFNPPIEVLNGSHKACFTPIGNGGRFHIHFGINSNNLDGGIMAVERLLKQSLTRR